MTVYLSRVLNKMNYGITLDQPRYTPMRQDQMMVRFNKAKSVTIKLGNKIASELNWRKGDRIAIYHYPDDVLRFMLVKSESGNGWHLQQRAQRMYFEIKFSLQNEIPVAIKDFSTTHYQIIDKNRLEFRPENKSE